MARFTEYKAVERLRSLAQDPFDLTKKNSLTPERLNHFIASSCGYRLLYGTERITDDVMAALFELAKESQALDKMARMQSGEVINSIEGYPSENRAVLHTATRDFFEKRQSAAASQEAAVLAYAEIEKLKAFMEKINQEQRFTDLIMIGIGGSDLGPKAHCLALEYLQNPQRRLHFICNIDPDDVVANLQNVDLSKSMVLVISKTGTTLETVTNEAFVRQHFIQKGLKPEEHFVTVSLKGSPLDNPSQHLACFYIWDWVGGRYSTSSMVGGVVLSFACGFETYWELLKGANAMDKAALNDNLESNLPLLGALLTLWNRNFLGFPTEALIPYSQALLRYPAHIQQVGMESNGKSVDKHGKRVNFDTGPILWGEPGTNAQHSFFQLIHQGTTVVPVEMIGFRESQHEDDFSLKGSTSQQKLLANLFAQAIALATGQQSDNPNKVFEGNRPTHILLGKRLMPYALGVLLAYFEHKIAFQGFIWNINSFDQEGVQLGKVLAGKVLECFSKKDSYPLGSALIDQLNQL